MIYVCFFLVYSSSSICTTCIQSDLSQDMAKIVTFEKILKLLFVSKKKVFSKSLLFLDVGDMIYVCFFLVLSSSSICTTCIQSDLSQDMAKMVTFEKNLKLLFVCKKKVFSKSLLYLDVGDMIYVCFFLVHSSSSICTTRIQSDLSQDMAKMVTFEKNLKLLFVSKKKVFSKSLRFLEM